MLTILAESPWWIAVNKPMGLNVEQLHDFASVERSVAQLLQQRTGHPPFVGVVHRLDRPVSGVLLLALRRQALKQLNAAFSERSVHKQYLAITEGIPSQAQGQLRHYLRKDQLNRRAVVSQRPGGGAHEALLDYQLLATHGGRAMLAVVPQGGKFHQIRAQLGSMGWPIMGDNRYGAQQFYQPEGIALHARSLRFPDPQTGKWVEVLAPPPQIGSWEPFVTFVSP